MADRDVEKVMDDFKLQIGPYQWVIDSNDIEKIWKTTQGFIHYATKEKIERRKKEHLECPTGNEK